MPVFNAGRYVESAVHSILGQTFADFELLAIDDGSTDGSVDIIRSIEDRRIRLVTNARNLGLIATLNRGLAMIETEFVARMDADDLSAPTRLEKQVALLDRNPEVGACGCDLTYFTDAFESRWRYETEHERIVAGMVFHNSMPHPSAVFRTAALLQLREQYRDAFLHAEDWDLWWRLAKTTKLTNVPEPLYRYRGHAESVTNKHRDVQQKTCLAVRSGILGELAGDIGPAKAFFHDRILRRIKPMRGKKAMSLVKWALFLLRANEKTKLLDRRALVYSINRHLLPAIVPRPKRLTVRWALRAQLYRVRPLDRLFVPLLSL